MKNPASLLWSRVRHAEWEHAAVPTPPVAEEEGQIPVLLALRRPSDQARMRLILHGTSFLPVLADGIDHACKIAGHIVIPVVVYDPFFDAADRQAAFRRKVGVWRAPSIILVCDSEAPEIGESSNRMSASSILSRPLRRETAIPALHSAYFHWKSGRTSLCDAAEKCVGAVARQRR